MFSTEEGGSACLIDATSNFGVAVCPKNTIRANNRFIMEGPSRLRCIISFVDIACNDMRGRLSRSGAMCPEKRMNLAHCQGNPLWRLLPRENAYFGVWREHRGFHGDNERMRWNIVRQD